MRLVALLLLAVAAAGCNRKMTEDDCAKVAAHLREVWLAEAKNAAPTDGPAAEKASAVIKSEAERVVGDWSAECKKDLQGQLVDPREMDCLLKAKSFEETHRCAEL